MEYIEIENKDWAKNVMLQSIVAENKPGLNFLSDRINLNGFDYIISSGLFKNIMDKLELEKTIKIKELNVQNILDSGAVDPEEYIFSEIKIKSDKISFCSFTVKDANKIKKEISRLNSIGFSVNKMRYQYREAKITKNKNSLKSIHLVTESVAVKNIIFLVLDERFENPVLFSTKNNKGNESSIKKLHNIAYFADVPGKRVDYNKEVANNINNGIFKRKEVADYIKSNKLDTPTLVQKIEVDGRKILALKSNIIKTLLINQIPTQYRTLYIHKTK